MTITINWPTKIIDADASIVDLPAFHAELRDLEDSPVGVIYPVTHTWKALDLGSGAFFYGLALINGYSLRFPVAGNYSILGNLDATILPVAGVYVERKTSAAFATTAVGGSGPSAASIAEAVRTNLAAELAKIDAAISSRQAAGLVAADVQQVNGVALTGNGSTIPWGPA